MQISKISTNNVNFGYDEKLHRKIHKRLASIPDRQWAESLINLDKYCNSYEDRIRQMEKDKKQNSPVFKDCVDIFLTLKDATVGYISAALGDTSIAEDEAEYYEKDYDKHAKTTNDWRIQTAGVIDYWSDKVQNVLKEAEKNNPFPSKKDLGIEDSESLADDLFDDDDDDDETVTGKEAGLEDEEAKSLIEEFKPTENSPSGFSDVAGMDKLKEELEDGILLAIKNPEAAKLDFEEYGKTFPRGILLYGPPGCGKTYVSQALSQEADVPMYSIDIGKAGSHFINQTATNLQKAFDYIVDKANESKKPCIIFLDEIDSLCMKRDERTFSEDIKLVDTMLKLMDKAKDSHVFIVAATNKPKLVDFAVRRRFNSKVYVDLPDEKAIKTMVSNFLSKVSKGKELLSQEENIDKIVKELEGYSNDSILKISQNAGIKALKRNRDNISFDDFKQAIKETIEEKPNVEDFILDDDKKTSKIGFAK